MTPGLLKSLRTEMKLYETFIKPLTVEKICLKHSPKTEKIYYELQFRRCSNDFKQTLTIIKTIINPKSSDTSIKFLISNDTKVTDSEQIAEGFNNYYTSAAQELIDKIPISDKPILIHI